MSDEWISGEDPTDPSMSPYVHWWFTKEKAFLPLDIEDAPAGLRPMFRGANPAGEAGKDVGGAFYKDGEALLLSKCVANPLPMKDWPDWSADQIADRLPSDIPADTVITGILDTGIALSHMTTNIEAGKTRVISSWQQGAEMVWVDPSLDCTAGETRPADDWLPCGREVFQGEIDAALAEHGNARGVVDEEAFNRHLELSAPDALRGNRDLELSAAHGTHTLSLAAGIEPTSVRREDLERQRIIAVNLPAQYHHGSAGNFLAYFAVFGVDRILHVADALWEKNTSNPDEAGITRGFPIVINFSYGMTGGPKDGNHIFEQALANIIDQRKEAARDANQTASPVRIMMPVGNENLAMGAASIALGKEGSTPEAGGGTGARQAVTLPWRIKPSDTTPNFLEIWSGESEESVFDDLLEGARLFVTPPGQNRTQLGALEDGKFQDLGGYARVYCQHVKIDRGDGLPTNGAVDGGPSKGATYKLALLVCIAPTTTETPDAPCAPAGEWKVEMEYEGETPVGFNFYIQTDQSAVVTSATGLRSYFDHPNYRTHLTEHPSGHESESGATADTFSFDEVNEPIDNDDWGKFGPVQRRGSHNALSSLSRPEIIAVGSFDDADGYPTAYSASTNGNPQSDQDEVLARERNTGREVLTVCYPGENAPSLFGLIGSGSRDGSVTNARGTSMSTGLATREAALAFLDAPQARWDEIGTQDWFCAKAQAVEAGKKSDVWGQELTWPIPGEKGRLKMGWGRLPDPRSTRVNRLGEEDWGWQPVVPVPAAE